MSCKLIPIPGIVVSLFLLVVGIPIAQSAEQSLSPADKEFLEEAAKGGMIEVAMAGLAKRKASDPGVKDFAQEMEQHHTAANQQLRELAKSVGTTLPENMGEEHQKMIDELAKLSGTEFDRSFMDHIVIHHKEDLKVFKREAMEGDNPSVKSFASKMVPKLEGHLSMASSMHERLAGGKIKG